MSSDETVPADPIVLPRMPRMRTSVVIPIVALIAAMATYVAAMAFWPLHEVAPQIEATSAELLTAPESNLTWPEQGSAAAGVLHVGSIAHSGTERVRMASISKLITALMVLERSPLALGEEGTTFFFTQNDRNAYNQYRNRGETALNVPVGGSLTQYQLLQGALIGSANNYSDRLVTEFWGSGAVYKAAADEWLAARGLDTIRIADGTSTSSGNTIRPEDAIKLAQMAIANPVIREIVGTTQVTLPGAGRVTTTNPLLGDEGVIGVTQGSYSSNFHLLVSKDAEVAGAPVRLFAAVLNQGTRAQRDAQARDLLAQLEAELNEHVQTIPAGTVVGNITTVWGETAQVVTAAAIDTPLWNGESARTDATLDINWDIKNLKTVGTFAVIGPLGARSVDVVLSQPLAGPDFWWRVTHPLELLGIFGDD